MHEDSNGTWGEHHDGDEDNVARYDKWRAYPTLPDDFEPLESFLAERGLRRDDLERVNCRYSVNHGIPTLSYLFPDGIKWRTLTDPPKRESEKGVKWNRCLLLNKEATKVIVAEGETDAAQLFSQYPELCVAALPSGGDHVPASIIEQLSGYERVYVATDNDDVGNAGADKLLAGLPRTAVRMLPPVGKDWCESVVAQGHLDPDPETYVVVPPRMVYTVREIEAVDFGAYQDNHWFEDGVLPMGGQLIIHAPLKSLKSVVMLDMIRALTTGTTFAGPGGYMYLKDEPAKVLLFQMEVRPEAFQRRLLGVMSDMLPDQRDAFRDNFMTYQIADRKLPRLKVTHKDFKRQVLLALEESQAQVVAFDPLQRLTGDADLNQSNEMDKLLDFFAELQNPPYDLSVISCHHNNKASGVAAKHAQSMTGSQRFGADADSICSLWHDPKIMGDDDNPEKIKRRNFRWTQRDGSAEGRSVEARPHPDGDHMMTVKFGPLLREGDDPDGILPENPSFK